jgi:GNAT superfamily N-acetyltransferase
MTAFPHQLARLECALHVNTCVLESSAVYIARTPLTSSTRRALSLEPIAVEHSVHVNRRRRGGGVGAALMQALLPIAATQGKHVMIAAIDAANAGSIRFHERLGFVSAGHQMAMARGLAWATVRPEVLCAVTPHNCLLTVFLFCFTQLPSLAVEHSDGLADHNLPLGLKSGRTRTLLRQGWADAR